VDCGIGSGETKENDRKCRRAGMKAGARDVRSCTASGDHTLYAFELLARDN